VSVQPVLRAGRDDDADGFIALVSACWRDYPGCVMDLDGEVPELRALASHFANQGGTLLAAEQEGRIVGMAATRPAQDGAWELCKMYVAAGQRGHGLAHRLLDAVEDHARAQGAANLKLWTDTRFDRAHRFYEKNSFVRSGPLRALDDISHSIEFPYVKPLAGVQLLRLDAAGAASAEARLTRILQRCVESGASVSYLPPVDPAVFRAFWRRVSGQVAAGTRVLLGAWVDGVLAGTAMLDLDTPSNQPHRAEVKKLLVTPEARRRGVARLLMQRIEAEAQQAGRSLLTLDTRAEDAGDQLYRSLRWTEAGRIPGFALNADLTPCDTLIFWKNV
jgi:GNAT superfamily N-acetyltransferase